MPQQLATAHAAARFADGNPPIHASDSAATHNPPTIPAPHSSCEWFAYRQVPQNPATAPGVCFMQIPKPKSTAPTASNMLRTAALWRHCVAGLGAEVLVGPRLSNGVLVHTCSRCLRNAFSARSLLAVHFHV